MAEKLLLADKQIDSPMVHMTKIGQIPRSDANKTSEELGRIFISRCKELNITHSYDVTYGGYPDEVRYSEFFAGAGGIQVGPACGKLVRRLYNRPYDESNNVDFCDLLNLKTTPNNDKYKLHTYDIETMKGLVVLPGSNLLEGVVDKEKLNAAMILGAHLKMHPLTRDDHKAFLIEQYGEDKIIPTMYSGYKSMLNANVIYITGTSELGLYSMLLGKPIIDIATGDQRGGYVDAFNRVVNAPNQKDELNQLLNNPASGIILPALRDPEQQINDWLEIYQEMLKDHDTAEIPPLARNTVL